MKNFLLRYTLVLVGLITFGSSGAESQKNAAPTIWPSADLKWTELPNSGGVMRTILWGDPAKGAYGAIYRFPPGSKQPLHYHTNGMKIVVISGTLLYTPEGGTEHRLGPGSYLAYGPNDKHLAGSTGDSECTFFMEQPGKFDMVPINKGSK